MQREDAAGHGGPQGSDDKDIDQVGEAHGEVHFGYMNEDCSRPPHKMNSSKDNAVPGGSEQAAPPKA